MIRNHLNILVHLAKIDGELEEKERKLIETLGIKGGLTEEEVNDIIDNPSPFKIDAFTLVDRFEQFSNVVEIMMVDGKLHERELKFCSKLSKKMGVQDVLIHILIKVITDGQYTQKEKEEVRKEIFPFNQRGFTA